MKMTIFKIGVALAMLGNLAMMISTLIDVQQQGKKVEARASAYLACRNDNPPQYWHTCERFRTFDNEGKAK